jgi:6-phosphogluconolactonase (cycloisomerase 2 family)
MVMTGQRAACWTVVTRNGRYGYVINAGTGNISGFSIAKDGAVSLLNTDGVTAVTGGNPRMPRSLTTAASCTCASRR